MKIAELLDAPVRREPIAREQRKGFELPDDRVGRPRKSRAAIYEDDVFAFLVERRKDLGVARVRRFENLLIGGALILDDKRVVLMR
jgi:hypothetical protein